MKWHVIDSATTWRIVALRCREPVPDPALASVVKVQFEASGVSDTRVTLEHREFERHGGGAADYRAALAAPEGWSYILQRFAAVAN